MKNLNKVHLSGLRAVEAVGRLGSLKEAASELGVTIGAVSQQLQKTERQLGRTLFERRPGGLRKTPLGEEIVRRLTVAMTELSAAVDLADTDRNDTLTVSIPPVLAEKWLVKRLSGFHRQNSHIRVRLDASVTLIDPNRSDVDLCIRVGRGEWSGVRLEKLIDQCVFPVCSPGLAKNLTHPADLADYPIITDPDGMFEWDAWLGPNGLSTGVLGDGPVFTNASLCIDAAIAGLGIFLAWEPAVTDALEAGQLVTPFPDRYPTDFAYWIVEAEHPSANAGVAAFKRWLKDALPKPPTRY
ncbi:LysR substrate-binding domain-containing protein [Hoeflea prorocentri]|uniref:LysR substrate-binding domain-containing protein n=1 Tax=Hoeflea prorocentri TaxID=1922333 RepID=A0A9X3UQ81_9HYPH|nr:LysR substrate-binding domain-containing protein [Hoeflea prorocentri]MCY6383374.1 LysR substrate-binding domain-containing protein [Hoeflea prorocentri]MDA5401174.1 LysR substrate-binding domain-containing protein [Hoeflea prorocentri]